MPAQELIHHKSMAMLARPAVPGPEGNASESATSPFFVFRGTK